MISPSFNGLFLSNFSKVALTTESNAAKNAVTPFPYASSSPLESVIPTA